MSILSLEPPATPAAPLHTRRRGRSLETVVFLIGVALIAAHVLDDNYVQPQPGMSPGDHVVSGLVPLALLGLAAWAHPRLRGGRRGALALVAGVLGIAAGIEGFHYAREVGPSGDDFTSLLCLPAGVLLLGLGAVTLWRTRRTEGSLWWRYPRRVADRSRRRRRRLGGRGARPSATRPRTSVVPWSRRTGSASHTRT